MGLSWSKRHNYPQNPHHHHNHNHHPPPPPPPPSSSSSQLHVTSFNPTYAPPPYSPPPPPPPQQYPPYPPPPPYSYNYYYQRPTAAVNNQLQQQQHYNFPQISLPLLPPPPPQPSARYVDHQSAIKIKNDVNVHKHTITLRLDDRAPDCHLVSFTFDALVDGSITIFYFAKEGENCRFSSVYPEIVPVKIPFNKGLGQKFCQPSGTGVDLGFFDIDDLSKPITGEDVYPLVISAESSVPSAPVSDQPPNAFPHAQISQAVLEKRDGGNFQVKVMKQILWIDGSRYELREIFGISDSNEADTSNMDSGKECIICLTEVKNTAVLPCRHMCMCSDCAKELRLQSNKCPVCRQPIEELLEIKVDEESGLRSEVQHAMVENQPAASV